MKLCLQHVRSHFFRSLYVLGGAWISVVAGCPNPQPNPPPAPDADAMPAAVDASDVIDASAAAKSACSNLRRFPECARDCGGACETRFDILVTDKLVQPPFNLTCITNATSAAEARKCPGIVCGP